MMLDRCAHYRRWRGATSAVVAPLCGPSILVRLAKSCCLAAALVLVFPADEWLDQTMPRHLLVQIPLLILVGGCWGYLEKAIQLQATYAQVAAVVFFLGTMVYWMLPIALDDAVINAAADQLMHLNFLAAGLWVGAALKEMPFAIKTAFTAMVAAMILTAGILLVHANDWLCSAYSVEQQRYVGKWLIGAGVGGFLCLLLGAVVALHRAPGRASRG